MKFLVFMLLFILVGGNECHKILVVFPMVSQSHFILGSNIARGLAEAGNDVSFLSAYEDKTPVKNGTYRQLSIPELEDLVNGQDSDMFQKQNTFTLMTSMTVLLEKLCATILNSTHIQTLLKNKETFDVVLLEEFTVDSLKVLPHLFKAHFIAFSSVGPVSWINEYTGNPTPLAYAPEMNTGFPIRMPFFTRVANILINLFTQLFKLYRSYNHEAIVRSIFPNVPPINDYKYNVSLVFLNSNPGTVAPLPLVPNIIPIGGYHVQPPKPLPTHLQSYLDNAEHGVVYFSMGSMLKSKNMPPEKVKGILNTFRQLKQKVLWKWEEESLDGKPDNVRIEKWLPQSSILAHPNVKLFITHGGLLSTTETIYHGKPVLAVPIFGDQPNNAQQMVNGGFALKMHYNDLADSNVFLANIRELLNNTQYYENAQIRSKIYHDLPMKPMDSINYWVDYVVRHNGAKHLRVVGAELYWYQNALLDVWAFILAVIFTTLGGFCWLVKRRFYLKFKKNQPKNKQS